MTWLWAVIGFSIVALVVAPATSFAAEATAHKIVTLPARTGSAAPHPFHAPAVASAPRSLPRNAIGVAIGARPNTPESNLATHQSLSLPATVHGPPAPAAATPRIGGSAMTPALGRPAVPGAGHANVTSTGSVHPLNRGVIAGTVRPTSAPAVIGGPAKAGGGINGSTIAPKH